MKKVAALVMLLVGVLASDAHDANPEGWSTTQSTAASNENSSKLSAARNQSVVVNWSLVCEDLCGAGFGGPTCGVSCTNSSSNAYNANNKKYDTFNVCPILCEFGLGGKNCNCGNRFKIPKNTREVCQVICQYFNISINGCSKCVQNEEDTDKSVDPISSAPTTPLSTTVISTKHTGPTLMPPNQSPTETPATTTTIEPVTIPSTEPPPTTTTPYTTITSTGSTTPDWNEVCKELCKKGEGGALCNCDSPPLSRMSN